jgi:nitrogen-specific signal transduction histidine kinase
VWRSALSLARTSLFQYRVTQQIVDLEHSYQDLLHLWAEPVLSYDSSGSITYLNAAAQNYLSVSSIACTQLTIKSLFGQKAWHDIFGPLFLSNHASTQTYHLRPASCPDLRLDLEIQVVRLPRSLTRFELMVLLRAAHQKQAESAGSREERTALRPTTIPVPIPAGAQS